MKFRQLGTSSLIVSLLGVGGIPLQRFDAENAYQIVSCAYENEVNFIDTARAYTSSEELLGSALSHFSRSDFVLASKSKARTYADMARDIDLSLKNLKTDHIDLYQCHCVASDAEIEQIFSADGAYRALTEAVDAGKIGHIGFSAHKKEIAEKLILSGKFETVQYAFNFIETGGADIHRLAAEHEMGSIVMKPLGGGAIKSSELSLRYIGRNEFISVMIPGVDDREQLEKNIAAIEHIDEPITDSELSAINAEAALLGEHFCRKCDYCQPCTNGINISDILMLDGYYTRYNLVDWAVSRYNSGGTKADECAECGECEARCPYELPIRSLLKAAHSRLNR